MSLTEVIAALPDLAARRAAATQSVVDRRATAAAIVAMGEAFDQDRGVIIGPEAVAQAAAYLADDPAQQATVELGHGVFNLLRGEISGAPVTVHRSVDKIDLMNQHPEVVTAVIAWRAAAPSSPLLAEGLRLWDAQERINTLDPLPAMLITGLVTAGICSPELRTLIEAACTFEVSGPRTTALEAAGLGSTTVEEVIANV